jgi:hypothetical protein
LALRELLIFAKSPFGQTPSPPVINAAKGFKGREYALPTNKPTIKGFIVFRFLVAEKTQR